VDGNPDYRYSEVFNMALIWFDGFNELSGANNQHRGYSSSGSIDNTKGASFYLQNVTQPLESLLGDEVYLGGGYWIYDAATVLALLDSGGQWLGNLNVHDGGRVRWRDRNNVQLHPPTPPVIINEARNYIEVGIKLAKDGSGWLKIKVNSILVVDYTGRTVVNDATNQLNVLTVVWGVAGGRSGEFVKDAYLCDATGPAPHNTFLGDCGVVRLPPNGNGDVAQWDIGGSSPPANAYQAVDEANGENDTDYIQTDVVGERHLFTHAPVTVLGAIRGIYIGSWIKKDTEGNTEIRNTIRTGGADFEGASFGTTTSWVYKRTFWPLNPDTGLAWTQEDIDALQFGPKKQA
jgi:hypothetical protein